MAINASAFQTLYQIYYPDSELPYHLPENLPLLNMLMGGNTDGQVSGYVTDMPWLLSPSTGVSQSFNIAQQASNNAPTALRPQVYLSQLYKLVDFSDKSEYLSRGEAAYGDLMENVMSGVRMDFLNKLDQLCHGTGSGVRCSIAASATSATITLGTNAAETYFEIGDRIVTTTNNPTDGTAPTFSQGPFTVTAVGQNTITINTSITVTSSQFVAIYGDTLGFSSALVDPAIIGVGAFNPYTAPTAGENFLGVDRSVFVNRAAGYRYDGSTRSIEAATKRIATYMSQGGVASGGAKVFYAPTDMDALEDKLASYQRFSQSQLGVFFFDSIALNSPLGRLECVADPHQDSGYARLYKPGGLELQYKDGLPHLASLSGGVNEEFGQNFDGRSLRLRGYCQLRCLDGRKQGIVKLPTIA